MVVFLDTSFFAMQNLYNGTIMKWRIHIDSQNPFELMDYEFLSTFPLGE